MLKYWNLFDSLSYSDYTIPKFKSWHDDGKKTLKSIVAKLGIPLESAHRTQALIHLKTEYCDKKRCLDCAIGNSVLNIK